MHVVAAACAIIMIRAPAFIQVLIKFCWGRPASTEAVSKACWRHCKSTLYEVHSRQSNGLIRHWDTLLPMWHQHCTVILEWQIARVFKLCCGRAEFGLITGIPSLCSACYECLRRLETQQLTRDTRHVLFSKHKFFSSEQEIYKDVTLTALSRFETYYCLQ